MTVAIKINEELNGIELYFESKPQQEVLSNLKSNGFRWSGFKKCWYTKQSEKALQLANNLTNETNNIIDFPEVKETKTTIKKQPKKVEIFSLWNATQWTELEVNNNQDTKQIAKEIRSHLKNRFPICKFSVTSDYNRIYVTVKQSPFEEESKYIAAIKSYCNKLVNAYKYCYSVGDPYSDIPSSYNFYFFNTSIEYDYKQTEVTEEIKKDMLVFDAELLAHEEAEQQRKEEEFQKYMQEQELRNQEHKKQQEEEKKQIENIHNSVDVKTLDEKEIYFVTGSEFANLNKNNTLDEYKEEVSKGDYSLETVKITKEVHFNNEEALINFSNMLLHDFEFLANTGGSYTDDNRINSMTDFYNLDDYEKKTIQWNLYGVAIYFNNELQFIVDAQGYSYARYVGLTDNAKIEKSITVDQVTSQEELTELKQQAELLEELSVMSIEELNIIETWQTDNWKEYKELMKNKLKQYDLKLTKSIIQQLEIETLKQSMYKLLTDVDGIQEQFKDADIQKGEKVTLFYISDFGSIVTSRITFDSAIPSKYAQYDNAIKLTFTPEKKRNLHYKHFYSTLLVYNGWHSLPDTVLNEVEHKNGYVLTKSKYHSCDNRQYDEILNHFEQQGLKTVVNTYKPSF